MSDCSESSDEEISGSSSSWSDCSVSSDEEINGSSSSRSECSESSDEGKFGIDHACDLAKRIGHLLFDEKTADVILIVEGERLPAHRAILGSSSKYFRNFFLGDTKESLEEEVVLSNVPLRGFRMLMGYLYTGQVRLAKEDEDAILELLDIAHIYGYAKLEASLTEHLKKSISQENVGKIYSQAHRLGLSALGEPCCSLLTRKPSVTLKTEAFCDLSPAAICHLLSHDTFQAPEIEIFEAILRWRAKHQAEKDLGRILGAVRLPLIDTEKLVTTVKSSGLISMDLIADAIEAQVCNPADLNFRGSLRNDVNLATAESGTLMQIAAPNVEYTSARSCCEYAKYIASCTSDSSFPEDPGYTIALSEPFFINHIGFHIFALHRCRYYVETSVDLQHWARIIDRTNSTQLGFQDLYFERRVVRYIRLVHANNCCMASTKLKVFFMKLEVNHVTKPFKLSQGYYAPEENVSTRTRGATVSGADIRSTALLQEGETDVEDGGQWTSHDIGAGSIKICLPQPYTVGSMRMLLRSDESRAYLYYVETSLDDKTWTRVTEETRDFCRSWQHITFEPRPVLYINIVGTASTVDEVFSCSRFECPAPSRDDVKSNEAVNEAGGSGSRNA